MPELRVVMEHITTAQAAEFVAAAPAGTLAASVTPQHMLLNRNALFVGGLRPHAFCLPILKREEHRRAVAAAATSGNPRFFLGTDSGGWVRACMHAPAPAHADVLRFHEAPLPPALPAASCQQCVPRGWGGG